MDRTSCRGLRYGVGLLLLALPFALFAATQYAQGTFTWGVTSAWSNASGGPYNLAWTGLNNAVFEIAPGAVTVNLTQTVTNIDFNASGFTLSGGTSITLANPTIITTSAATTTISTPLGGIALTKAGTGTLVLNGNNTFTGATNVNAGVLNIQSNTGTGTVAGGVVVAGGAALQLQNNITVGAEALTLNGTGITADGALRNVSGNNTWGGAVTLSTNPVIIQSDAGLLTLSAAMANGANFLTVQGAGNAKISGVIGAGAGGITMSGAGTLTLAGANTYTGATTVNSGTLAAGIITNAFGNATNVTIANAAGATMDITGFNNTIGSLTGGGASGGTVILGSGALLTVGNATSPAAYAGTMSGTGGIKKVGAGTITLTGTNTYSGSTTINVGTLAAASSGALGDESATNTLIFTGGTLQATGTINSPTTRSVTLTNTALIGCNSQAITIAGAMSGAGGVTSSGPGTLLLSGNNTFTGAVNVNAGGVLNIQNSTATGTVAGGVVVASGSALQMQNNITVGAEALTLNGTGISSDGALRNVSDINTWGGAITLSTNPVILQSDAGLLTLSGAIANGANLLTVQGAGNVTMSGVIGAGAGGVTMSGGGTLTLSGANTYTGPTSVNSGTLAAGVITKAFGNATNVTIANTSGATLDITGFNNTIGSLTGGGASGGAVVLGGGAVLTVGNATSPAAFAGVISGTGGILKVGAGTLSLSGGNTYSGSTTINVGTISAASSSALGDGSATNTLIFTGGTLLAAGTISSPATRSVTMTNTGIINNNGNSVTIAGAIGGANGLTSNGAGTLALTGANTYSGATTISAGTLNANSSAAIGDGSATNTLTFTGGTFQAGGTITSPATRKVTMTNTGIIDNNGDSVTFAGVISGAGGLTENSGGVIILSGANTYTGPTTINAGTLAAGIITNAFGNGSNVTIANAPGATIDITGFSNSIGSLTGGGASGGTVILGGGAILTVGNATSPAAYAGTLTGTGGFKKVGAGIITLTGVNTYSGSTTVNVGTLNANSSSALGDGSATNTLVFTGGTLQAGGSITSPSTRTVTLTNTAIIDNNGQAISIAGVMSGGGGITKNGAGTLTLTGTNTYTGATTVNVGTLVAGAATSSFGTNSAVSFANTLGAVMDVSSFNTTIGSITGGGGTGGNITLGGSTLTSGGNNASPAAYAGSISGTGSLIKVGAGNITLSGANSYSGTTSINAGTFTVNGSLAATSAVTVAAGATLAGTGTIAGAVDASAAGAIISPGSGGAGTLTITQSGGTALNLGAASVLKFDIGTVSDQVVLSGASSNLTLAGTLNITQVAGFAAGTYTLFTYTGTLTNNVVQLGAVPAGFSYQVSTATPGQVNLVIAPAGSPVQVYYSVGRLQADLKNPANVSITSGVATFSTAQPNNIGVGDNIVYDSDNKSAFISGRTSSTQYSVVTVIGGTPANVSNVTVNSIKRAFNHLNTAVNTTQLSAGSANFLNGTNLVLGNYDLNVACYGDSVDTCSSTVGTWTTDAAHYIKIYTPSTTAEVGISQRHNGTWDKTKYYTMTLPGATYVLGIKTNFVKVYGLQFDLKAAAGADAVLVDCSTVATAGVIEVAYNLITNSTPAGNVGGISAYNGAFSPTIKIYNNMIWGLTGTGNTCAMFLGWGSAAPTCYVYNNTSYNNYQGIMANAGTIVAKNNLMYQSVTPANNYVGTFNASGTNDLSGPPVNAGMPVTNSRNGVQVVFEDPSNSDFRLASSDTGARKFGINLFSDPNLSFADDLTGAIRPAAWDIGARQWSDSTSTQVPVLALPATNGSSNASLAINFTLPEAALAGSVTMTFTQTGGVADARSPHVITFNNTGGFENAGTHAATLNGTALTSNSNVASVTPASPNDLLVNGSAYSVRIAYQDALGNPVAAATNTNFLYSITAPTLIKPASNSYSNASLPVDFSLPLAAQAGTVKITFALTGGSADANAPHVVTFNNTGGFEGVGEHTTTLNGAALTGNSNVASVTPVSPNDLLVDGSVYSVSLAYKNGGITYTSTNTNFTYSSTPPAWTATYPKTGTIGGTSVQFLAKTNKNGKAYFVVLASGATAPSSAQVKAGLDASGNPLASGFFGMVAMIANYESDFSASNLVSGTTYDAYLVAEDVVPNLQAAPVKVTFTCIDVTPPNWAGGYPKTGTVGGTATQFLVETNENGIAFFVVLASGAATPSSTQVVAGQDATGASVASGKWGSVAVSANTQGSVSASGLLPSTTYDAYLVAQDAIPNLQASSVKVTFTTVSDITPPVNATNFPKIGIVTASTAQFLVETNENGNAFFVVVAHADVAPTSTQVKNGQNSAGGTPVGAGNTALVANTQASFSASGLVSGTTYDVYMAAQDVIPNLQTAPVMLTFTARPQPTFNWSRNDLVNVKGAAIGNTEIYVGAANALYGLSLSNGNTVWSYTSGQGTCGIPSYTYNTASSTYRIVVCQGTYLIRYDDPAGYQWSVNLGASPGTPYVSIDDNSVYVLLGNNKLTKRSMASGARDGTFGGGSDVSVANASILCDINVFSGYVMVGSTGGVVTLFDAGTGAVFSSYSTGSGASINQPLVSQNYSVYVAPATSTLYARSSLNLNNPQWSSGLALGGTTSGPPWADALSSKIYVPAGPNVIRVSDNGSSGSVDVGYSYNAGATIQSGPLLFNGYVYFGRNGGQYHCYNDGTMASASSWPYQNASGNATSGPWIDVVSTPHQVIFGTDAGDLHAFNTQ